MQASPRLDPSAKAASRPADDDCRCHCGSLLARWVEGGVELKCRRCKRRIVLPLPAEGRPPRAPTVLPAREAG